MSDYSSLGPAPAPPGPLPPPPGPPLFEPGDDMGGMWGDDLGLGVEAPALDAPMEDMWAEDVVAPETVDTPVAPSSSYDEQLSWFMGVPTSMDTWRKSLQATIVQGVAGHSIHGIRMEQAGLPSLLPTEEDEPAKPLEIASTFIPAAGAAAWGAGLYESHTYKKAPGSDYAKRIRMGSDGLLGYADTVFSTLTSLIARTVGTAGVAVDIDNRHPEKLKRIGKIWKGMGGQVAEALPIISALYDIPKGDFTGPANLDEGFLYNFEQAHRDVAPEFTDKHPNLVFASGLISDVVMEPFNFFAVPTRAAKLGGKGSSFVAKSKSALLALGEKIGDVGRSERAFDNFSEVMQEAHLSPKMAEDLAEIYARGGPDMGKQAVVAMYQDVERDIQKAKQQLDSLDSAMGLDKKASDLHLEADIFATPDAAMQERIVERVGDPASYKKEYADLVTRAKNKVQLEEGKFAGIGPATAEPTISGSRRASKASETATRQQARLETKLVSLQEDAVRLVEVLDKGGEGGGLIARPGKKLTKSDEAIIYLSGRQKLSTQKWDEFTESIDMAVDDADAFIDALWLEDKVSYVGESFKASKTIERRIRQYKKAGKSLTDKQTAYLLRKKDYKEGLGVDEITNALAIKIHKNFKPTIENAQKITQRLINNTEKRLATLGKKSTAISTQITPVAVKAERASRASLEATQKGIAGTITDIQKAKESKRLGGVAEKALAPKKLLKARVGKVKEGDVLQAAAKALTEDVPELKLATAFDPALYALARTRLVDDMQQAEKVLSLLQPENIEKVEMLVKFWDRSGAKMLADHQDMQAIAARATDLGNMSRGDQMLDQVKAGERGIQFRDWAATGPDGSAAVPFPRFQAKAIMALGDMIRMSGETTIGAKLKGLFDSNTAFYSYWRTVAFLGQGRASALTAGHWTMRNGITEIAADLAGQRKFDEVRKVWVGKIAHGILPSKQKRELRNTAARVKTELFKHGEIRTIPDWFDELSTPNQKLFLNLAELNKDTNNVFFAREVAAGVSVDWLSNERDFSYMAHLFAEEWKSFMKANKLSPEDVRKTLKLRMKNAGMPSTPKSPTLKHRFMKQRTSDLHVDAMNDHAKLAFGTDVKMLIDDPGVVNFIRGEASNRVVTASDYALGFADRFAVRNAPEVGKDGPVRKVIPGSDVNALEWLKKMWPEKDGVSQFPSHLEARYKNKWLPRDIADKATWQYNVFTSGIHDGWLFKQIHAANNIFKGLTLYLDPRYYVRNFNFDVLSTFSHTGQSISEFRGNNKIAAGIQSIMAQKAIDNRETHAFQSVLAAMRGGTKERIDPSWGATLNNLARKSHSWRQQIHASESDVSKLQELLNYVSPIDGKKRTLEELIEIFDTQGIVMGDHMHGGIDVANTAGTMNTYNGFAANGGLTNGVFGEARRAFRNLTGDQNPMFAVSKEATERLRLNTWVHAYMNGMSIPEANRVVHKTFLDYGRLTQFEQKYMTRLFTFYRWNRKSIPLSMRMFMGMPRFNTAMMKAQARISGKHAEEGKLSPWQIERQAMAVGPTVAGQQAVVFGLPTAGNELVNNLELYTDPLKKAWEAEGAINKLKAVATSKFTGLFSEPIPGIVGMATGRKIFGGLPIAKSKYLKPRPGQSYAEAQQEMAELGFLAHTISMTPPRKVLNAAIDWWRDRRNDTQRYPTLWLLKMMTGLSWGTSDPPKVYEQFIKELKREVQKEKEQAIREARAR